MTTRVRGSASVRVQVTGVSAIQRALRPLLDPEFTQRVDAANKKGAQSLAKDLRAEARPLSKRMARSVRVKRAKTGKPGWVVGSRRKVAFFWPFVINGTRDHGPRKAAALSFQVNGQWVRAKRVRGVKPHPIVEAVVARRESAVSKQIEADVMRNTGL